MSAISTFRPAPQSADQPAILVEGVAKRFGTVQALAGVDLRVQHGEFFGLLGPNGAGKTTLISILAGLTRSDAGAASIMGRDVRRDYRQARRALGVVPQELVFDPFFTVRETLRIQSGYFGLRRNDAWIDEIMASLDLTGKADANMRSLSGGMKRRVLVAQALVHRPPVIILDEPTAGVDVELRRGLWLFIQRLNREGHTIVLTTHYLEEAESLCGRIAMLKAGRIVALDSTANLVRRLRHLRLKFIAEGAVPATLLGRPVERVSGHCLLTLAELSEVEPALAELRGAGARLAELEIEQPDLEDVFLDVMGNANVTRVKSA
jgi:ABC-2 type transport system ATP-binding protein